MKLNNYMNMTTFLVMFLVFSYASVQLEAKIEETLKVGFYNPTCPEAETIVTEVVTEAYLEDDKIAPSMVRMHFHDCFVRGCDGSILIDSTEVNVAEKESPANKPSLRGFEIIDKAKARIEAICPETVSCADILAFAARDSIVLTAPVNAARNLRYKVPAGRRDGIVSLDEEVLQNIAGPTATVEHLIGNFLHKGLSEDDMTTLSGAHTIGDSHCQSIVDFNDRIYRFNGTNMPDPTLDEEYADELRQNCPPGSGSTDKVVPMDGDSSTRFDIRYYRELLRDRGLFTSDATLLTNTKTAKLVKKYAGNRKEWFRKFKLAMVKMGKIDVLTGSDGEIREKCSVINNNKESSTVLPPPEDEIELTN